jgi:hypothetical protein
MAGKLDQIIVIDVEATCWEGHPPANEESEIIEIGLCVMDVQRGGYWTVLERRLSISETALSDTAAHLG